VFEGLINMSHSSLSWLGNEQYLYPNDVKNLATIIFDGAKFPIHIRNQLLYWYPDVNVMLRRHDLHPDVS